MYKLEFNEAMHTSDHVPLLKTLPIALFTHALLIFGVSFVPSVTTNSGLPPVMDITLVQTHAEHEPEDAKFLAQANQEASGSADEDNRPRSPLASLQPDATDGVAPVQSQAAAPDNAPKTDPMLLTTKGETFEYVKKQPEMPEEETLPVEDNVSDSTQELARLLAEVDEAEARYARRPRVHFIDAVSAKSVVEAEYIDAWVKKIERVGNINFPEEAIQRNLSGKLILNVTLDHQGHVVDVQIDVSSGYNILDKAAVRIVKLASPYSPLPAEIRKKWDQLNITRTWIFHSGTRTLDTE